MSTVQPPPETPLETPLDTPRTWVEFIDPAEPGQRFRCDLTWLTSAYRCIFAAGCRGIDETRPGDGCCTLGAHFTDADDVARVRAVVEALGPKEWHLRAACPGADDWLQEADDDPSAEPELKTAIVAGACVLLNRPEFAVGAGCALHRYALSRGLPPHTVKPEVCWQLPIRRAYRRVERPDETTYLEVTIGEYDRRGWGPGGHDLDWYCSGSPLAHTAQQPLFVTCAPELTELMGQAAYEVLVTSCRAHLKAIDALGPHAGWSALVHPATAASRRFHAPDAGGP